MADRDLLVRIGLPADALLAIDAGSVWSSTEPTMLEDEVTPYHCDDPDCDRWHNQPVNIYWLLEGGNLYAKVMDMEDQDEPIDSVEIKTYQGFLDLLWQIDFDGATARIAYCEWVRDNLQDPLDLLQVPRTITRKNRWKIKLEPVGRQWKLVGAVKGYGKADDWVTGANLLQLPFDFIEYLELRYLGDPLAPFICYGREMSQHELLSLEGVQWQKSDFAGTIILPDTDVQRTSLAIAAEIYSTAREYLKEHQNFLAEIQRKVGKDAHS